MPHLTTAERIGRKIGREEGRIEELRDSIRELLGLRFQTIPADLTDRIAKSDDRNRLRSVLRLLFNAATMEEVEQALSAD